MNRFSSEKSLVYHCVADRFPAELPQNISWSKLEALLARENLKPLFYDWLKRQATLREAAPKDFLEKLQQSYYHAAARNALNQEAVKPLFAALREKNIPVLLHKGIYLMNQIYSSIALRPMGDIDLLIRPENRSAVLEALVSLKFKKGKDEETWSNDFVALDLHTDLNNTKRFQKVSPCLSLRMEQMWKGAKAIDFDGIPLLALNREDQLIALCFHLAFNHRLEGLLWYADLIRYLKIYRNELDWEKLIRRAKEFGNQKSVFYCLKYLQDHFEISLPTKILEALKPSEQSWMEKKIAGRIWKGKPAGKLGYFFSLGLIEEKKMRRRYFWNTWLS